MAYVLGYTCADGALTVGKRGNKFLDFTSVDESLIQTVRATLDSNHKINRKTRKENWRPAYRLQIGSKTMFDDLGKLGLTTKKAKRLVYPDVPKKYFADFVRGYFDGDGHVSHGAYKRKGGNGVKQVLLSGLTSSTKSFLEKLRNDLTKLGIVSGGTLYYKKGHRLTFSINDSFGLYEFLYKNAGYGLYLQRKKRVFEKFFRMRA